MAEIHAIINGNWNDASTWDLNRIPIVDDDVYIGDYEVTINDVVRTLKSLNFNGSGYLKKTASFTSRWICDVNITAITSVNAYFGTATYSGINLTGNLNIDCPLLPTTKCVAYGTAVINGNITANGGAIIIGNNATPLTINGDVYLSNTARLGTQQTYSMDGLLINGTLIMDANHVGPYAQQGLYSGNINRQVNRIINHSDFPVLGSINSGTSNYPYVFGDIYCKNKLADSISGYVLFNGNVVCEKLGNTGVHFTFNGDVTFNISNGIFGDNDIVGSGKITNPTNNSDYYLFNVNDADYPQETAVKNGVPYGNDNFVGQYTPDYPPESVVLKDYEYGDSDDRKTGTMEVVDIGDYPAESDVKVGVRYGNDEYEGTFQPVADYPAEDDVLKDVPYAYDQMHGKLNLDYPPEEVVLEGYVYDNEQKTGTLAQTAPVVNTINVYKKK